MVSLSESTASVGVELSDASSSSNVSPDAIPGLNSSPTGLLSLLGGVIGLLAHNGLLRGNLHPVIDQRVYRSAQLSPRQLDRVIRQYEIRTVISLRGGDEGDDWFRDQLEVCSTHQVRLEGISFTAMRLPRPGHLKKLLRLFDEVEKPLLLHCRGGADRTGLAATLYLHLYAGLPLDDAQRLGLTWRYGHFVSKAGAMDEFFDLYRANSDDLPLREWTLKRYPTLYKGRQEEASR